MTEREVAVYRRAQRVAYEVTQPFVRVMTDLMSFSSFTLIVSGDKLVEVRYPADVEALLAKYRAMAQEEMRRAVNSVLKESGVVLPVSE